MSPAGGRPRSRQVRRHRRRRESEDFVSRTLAAVAVLLAAHQAAWAIINPNFTPRHLAEQAEVILVGPVKPAANAMEWKMSGSALKGQAGECILDLAKCDKDSLQEVSKVLTASGQADAILFAGTLNQRKCAYLHLCGLWLSLAEGQKGRWEVRNFDAQMGATFVGGTDMLVRMTRYLLADPDGDVPVTAGTCWMDHCKIGQVKGEIAGLAAVEIGQPPKLCLFVGSSEGDRLYRPRKVNDQDGFEDITASCGLDSKSRRFAWTDLDGDGLADLVSFDGAAISTRLPAKDGTLRRAGAWRHDGEVLGLAPCSAGGASGVLVSTNSLPFLLTAVVSDKWRKTDLPSAPSIQDAPGRPSACVVADLDNDGYADLLLPREKGGLLWKGKPAGFESPAASQVCTGRGSAVVAVGDFDGDGSLDVFLAGTDSNTLWENDGKGSFTEVSRNAGSLSYKCPAGASAAGVMDLNHDGRADLCLVYLRSDLLYHWNRGYRSFGEEGELRLPPQGPDASALDIGQRALLAADFNGDFSQDLAVAMADGTLYCCFNDRTDRPGVNLRLKPGVLGPVTASCWMGPEKVPFCTGAVVVGGHSPPAYVAARFPGYLVVKWRLAGRPQQSRRVTVEDRTVEVLLEEQPPTTSKGNR
jgi:hypothetical protein